MIIVNANIIVNAYVIVLLSYRNLFGFYIIIDSNLNIYFIYKR